MSKSKQHGRRIGFVSTRFSGTDGVTLESAKWAEVLKKFDHDSFWYAGICDRPKDVSMVVPEAYFGDRENMWINEQIYGSLIRNAQVTRRIYERADFLKQTLYEFIERFEIGILVVQNALCIPMHVPLGVALTQLISETGIPTIAHHHDFYWERSRYLVNSISDLLDMAFPPSNPFIQHVTINSHGQEQLALRKGDPSVLVPNVLDFDNPPEPPDQYSFEFRRQFGLEPDDIIFLQPTRIVPRKGIQIAIQLLSKLKDPKCKLIVSHESGDEGDDYMVMLSDMAEQEGVDLRFLHTHVADNRGTDVSGEKTFSLADAYSQADFVTYPSLYEGFGNALLEAYYHRKPVLVNRYSIFISDIEPKGFECITMDGILTSRILEQVRRSIHDAEYRDAMVERNYQLAKSFFSYSVLRRNLRSIITNITGMDDL